MSKANFPKLARIENNTRKKAVEDPARSIIPQIFAKTRSSGFQDYLKGLLVELCHIDTTPKPDPAAMRDAENRCFRILERELGDLNFFGIQLERRPINPAIKSHPNYSLLHFTKTAERPQGLSAEHTYDGRSNLVCILPGTNFRAAGRSVALNAHIDVVAPYIPPRIKGGVVFGRGACDDKGSVVAMVAALKVLGGILPSTGVELNRNVLAMFVIEEETGGNGSLSLAIDRKLKGFYDSILVGECTDLKFHPANRGAVWYRAGVSAPKGGSPFEMFAFINEEFEKEGAAIRAESRHQLFPQRPVQTCHGIIGPYGEHPSRICGEVGFTVRFKRPPRNKDVVNLVQDCLESGLAGYVGLYGDKTKVIDPATGKQMVARHYDFQRTANGFEVKVYGATGHMGAIRDRDGAITKLAHLLRGLVLSKAKLEAVGGPVHFELGPGVNGKSRKAVFSNNGEMTDLKMRAARMLVLEGGQGFIPTHNIQEVMGRLRQAAQRGAENYLRLLGHRENGGQFVKVAFEKLHNVAFDGDADSATVRNAIEAAKQCGIWKDEPVLGWTVSCDARLFATEYPKMQVLTFGPGQLACAHSDREQIELKDMQSAVEFLAVFLLRQTGTLL